MPTGHIKCRCMTVEIDVGNGWEKVYKKHSEPIAIDEQIDFGLKLEKNFYY